MFSFKSNKDFVNIISNTNKLIIIDCYAPWCGPCQTIMPIIEKIADETNDCIFCKLNIDSNETEFLTKKFKIESVPHFLFIKNQKLIYQQSGANNLAILKHKIKELK